MAKLFANLSLVVIVGIILALAVMFYFGFVPDDRAVPLTVNSTLRWLHVFFGIMWIGLLYYFNFVQVPQMPKIPADQKGAVTGFIAPAALFFFRWAALLTLLTGLGIAGVDGYIGRALSFSGASSSENLIGLGMWLAAIMAFNVWFIIWPNQKKILGIVEATPEQKAKAGPPAAIASRLNTLLSIPMLYCMVSANLG